MVPIRSSDPDPADDGRKLVSGAPRKVVDIRVAAGPEAAIAARAAVGAALAGRVGDRVLAAAQLLVSELVSNSVRHAGLATDETVGVNAELRAGTVRLEVENPRTAGAVVVREPDLQRGGGFGLRVVDALADAWGISRDGDTCVWAELALVPATP